MQRLSVMMIRGLVKQALVLSVLSSFLQGRKQWARKIKDDLPPHHTNPPPTRCRSFRCPSQGTTPDEKMVGDCDGERLRKPKESLVKGADLSALRLENDVVINTCS